MNRVSLNALNSDNRSQKNCKPGMHQQFQFTINILPDLETPLFVLILTM